MLVEAVVAAFAKERKKLSAILAILAAG